METFVHVLINTEKVQANRAAASMAVQSLCFKLETLAFHSSLLEVSVFHGCTMMEQFYRLFSINSLDSGIPVSKVRK